MKLQLTVSNQFKLMLFGILQVKGALNFYRLVLQDLSMLLAYFIELALLILDLVPEYVRYYNAYCITVYITQIMEHRMILNLQTYQVISFSSLI